MGPRRQIGRCDPERGSKVDGGAAAEAVAAARKPVVMAMLMRRRLPVVVGMLLGAGLVVSPVQMQRGMGVAGDESDRQQQDQAAQEQGPLHGTGTQLRRFWILPKSGIAQGRCKVNLAPSPRQSPRAAVSVASDGKSHAWDNQPLQ